MLRFLQIECKPLHPQKDWNSLDCDTRFILILALLCWSGPELSPRFGVTVMWKLRNLSLAPKQGALQAMQSREYTGRCVCFGEFHLQKIHHFQRNLSEEEKKLLCRGPFPRQLPTSRINLDTIINTQPIHFAARSVKIQPSNASSLASTQHLAVFYKLVVLWVPSCTYVFFTVMCVEPFWHQPGPV